ncbi:hypothetical protein IWX90DRAFT_123464 [Phyllosticta citrichinensis]|uniref:Uncharacterized protein n=1 Tax=Phyllosticta citrichinensis TaxID=1130410 RepID=A0ABR1Y499_9PEZI
MVCLVWLLLSPPSGCQPLLDQRLFPWCLLIRHVSFISSTLFSQLPSMTTEPPTPRLRFAARLVDTSPPDHQIFIKSHSRPAPSPRYGLEGPRADGCSTHPPLLPGATSLTTPTSQGAPKHDGAEVNGSLADDMLCFAPIHVDELLYWSTHRILVLQARGHWQQQRN